VRVFALAVVNLERDVDEFLMHPQSLLVVFGRLGVGCRHPDDAGELARPDPPDVQVHDHRFATALDHVTNLLNDRLVHLTVEQHPARLPQQPPGPDGDDGGTDDAHDRVEPVPAERFPANQGDDSQDRSQGVGQDVQVGRAQVQVVVMVAVTVRMSVTVSVVAAAAVQQPRAERLTNRPTTATAMA